MLFGDEDNDLVRDLRQVPDNGGQLMAVASQRIFVTCRMKVSRLRATEVIALSFQVVS